MNRSLGARLAKSVQRMERDIRRSARPTRGGKKKKKGKPNVVAPKPRRLNRDRFATPATTWITVGSLAFVIVAIVWRLLYQLNH